MHYSALVHAYAELESTTKKLAKRDILSKLYISCPRSQLYKVVLLSIGSVGAELGIATELMRRAIAQTYSVSEAEVIRKYKELGDLGSAAEWFASRKRQAHAELEIDDVYDSLVKLPSITGVGSIDRKIALVSQLLARARPIEAKYITRTILGEMRIGVAHGIVRDAIAVAFDRKPEEIEAAWNVSGDFGRVAQMASVGKLKLEIALFTPVRVMLAERAPDLKSALEAFERPAIETKLDGFRCAIHKRGNRIALFSRRLEDVTNQFPEIVDWAKTRIKANECIVEGEILAVDPLTQAPRPFQQLSRRIQRKYRIEEMVKQIPVRIDLFDCIYLNGRSLMHLPLSQRWAALGRVIEPLKGKFGLIDHIETKNLERAERFYKAALALGEEGVVVKNLDAVYQPGRRVGYWLKVKPLMEPLDLVIIGGTWGLGKRARWIGSVLLGARKGEQFVATGMMGSGLTDAQFAELTQRLKGLIIEERGREIRVKPEVVVEVGYEEIQRSPKYPTGFALRFPKLLRFRDDKQPQDANTVSDIAKLFKQQKRFRR